jgi:hypothetical protein
MGINDLPALPNWVQWIAVILTVIASFAFFAKVWRAVAVGLSAISTNFAFWRARSLARRLCLAAHLTKDPPAMTAWVGTGVFFCHLYFSAMILIALIGVLSSLLAIQMNGSAAAPPEHPYWSMIIGGVGGFFCSIPFQTILARHRLMRSMVDFEQSAPKMEKEVSDLLKKTRLTETVQQSALLALQTNIAQRAHPRDPFVLPQQNPAG